MNRESGANFAGHPLFVSSVSIGGNNTSAPINWHGRIYILNRHGGTNLQDEYFNIWVYKASPN